MTISELLNEWMEKEQKQRIKKQTYVRYKGLIEAHICPCIGDFDVEKISRRQISDFLAEQKRDGNHRYGGQLSSVSVNLMHSILNMAFEYACDMEMLDANPCNRVKRVPSSEHKKMDAFTREEQKRLEKYIAEQRDDRLFGIILCFYTGLRIGELLGLEWEDLDEDCSVLSVSKTVYRGKDDSGEWELCVDTPKTQSSCRIIPLPEHVRLRLIELRGRSKSQFVVENKKGERMSTRSYQYIFLRLTEIAGVRNLNFHAIRHTFATRALEAGMDVKTLSEIMGHRDVSITLNRYTHSMIDTKKEMMKRMTSII